MKTATQEISEYITELKQLLHQSELIKQEVKHHITFSKLQNRTGAIKQQLDFIRAYILPKSTEEKAKYFKHNKLALKLINRHIDEIEKEVGETRLSALKEDEEQWAVIEELREETLHNLEHIEGALKQAELDYEATKELEETKDILLYQAEVAELADKTELLLKEMETHKHLHKSIAEQIHHLHHKLQFIKLHSDIHSHQHFSQAQHQAEFLRHHFTTLNEINEHLFHLGHHWGHVLHQLQEEHQETFELKQLHDEIRHTIEQFEEKRREIEENKLHYMQHPGAHIVPVKFNDAG